MTAPEFWDADDEVREEALSEMVEIPLLEAVYAVTIYGLGAPIQTTAHVHTLETGHSEVIADGVAEIVAAETGESDLVGVWRLDALNLAGTVVHSDIAWGHCCESAAEHARAWFSATGLDLDQVQGFAHSHW